MKAFRVAALATILAVLASGPLPAEGAGVTTQEYAFASWLVPTGERHHFKWFFAAGAGDLRIGVSSGREEPPFATIGRGTCITKRKPDYVRISCSARAQKGAEGPSAFKMDPAATEARLRVRTGGKVRRARIEAGAPGSEGLYKADLACGKGGGIARLSDATGRAFGRRLTTRGRYDYSVMMSGALVDTCDGAALLFSDLAAGERIRLAFVRR